MPLLRVGARSFDVDAIVFDKDDTLVDLNTTWGPVARTWIATLADRAGHTDDVLAAVLADRLGYDRAGGRLVPDSVMATHTLSEIGDRTVEILRRHGWDPVTIVERIGVAERAVTTGLEHLPLQPLADLVTLFTELRRAGLKIAIFTSDSARPTRHFLESCAIDDLVDVIVTGDGIDNPKPHGEGLQLIAEAVGTTPDRMVMVGDSLHDHGAARHAGAWFIAVGHRSAAAAVADVSVADVGEISAGRRSVDARPG